jgi:predicted TIM-barrel fold metal-dependent hydrolase
MGMSSYYEPIWDTCAETGMPVHFHGGSGSPPYQAENPGSMLAHTAEAMFWSHRPLWFMIAGSVLEEHPELKLVFAEQYSDWPPRVLGHMDFVWADSVWSLAESLPKRPSEYWRRQCFLGSSMLSRKEVELRYEIGVDKIMFGSDFPHPEGTWGKTTQFLQAAFRGQGVTEPEARAMLGENAARLYGLSLDELNNIAERCGPKLDEILSDVDAPIVDPHLEAALNRPLSP